MNIKDVEAISKKYANLLIKEGYTQIEDLLNLTKSQMSKLAKKTGIPVKMIDTFQELADLMRIDGVGDEIANVLNKIGIDSVKEFAQRNAKNTLERMKEFEKELAGRMPTLNDVKDWIQQATALSLGTRPEKKVIPKKEPSKKSEGDYGPNYWNNKYQKAPIIYTGRALRGKDYYKQIDADVKSFIKNNDAILFHVIDQAQLKKETFNETALAVQDFVNDFFKYKFDEETSDCPEFWQFPFESIQSGIGDCEYRLRIASIAKMEQS